jgi:hypothetical protein
MGASAPDRQSSLRIVPPPDESAIVAFVGTRP